MGLLSKTGLLASKTKSVQRFNPTEKQIELQTLIQPAPFITKPLAGLENPYPSGCSLLCRHPTGSNNPIVKRNSKIKQEPNDPTTITSNDSNLQLIPPHNYSSVPEILFKKYTETDSRPLTPTPSAITTATTTGVNRRCLTPQPPQRPKLIVDLRRTHSQETLSWTVYSEPVLSDVESPNSGGTPTSTRAASSKAKSARKILDAVKNKKDRDENVLPEPKTPDVVEAVSDDLKESDDEDDLPRRRGRKRKARSRVSTAIKTADNDPETQVASIQMDLENSDDETTNDKKIIPPMERSETELQLEAKGSSYKNDKILESFLDPSVIKILQRQLTQEIIDLEFDEKKKLALEEAKRCLSGMERRRSNFDDNLNDFVVDRELWLQLPRNYAVTNARFELPLDIDEFEKLTPLAYLEKYVAVTDTRKMLVNFIFKRYQKLREGTESRFILGKDIGNGLGNLMGRPLSPEQFNYIKRLVKWEDEGQYNFRTFSSICGLCERIFAEEYWPTNPIDRTGNEMEVVDFESLPHKLTSVQIDPELEELLMKIRNG